MLQQLCDNASNTVLIENNGVTIPLCRSVDANAWYKQALNICTYCVEVRTAVSHIVSTDVGCVFDGPGQDGIVDLTHLLPLLLLLKTNSI